MIGSELVPMTDRLVSRSAFGKSVNSVAPHRAIDGMVANYLARLMSRPRGKACFDTWVRGYLYGKRNSL